jgi:putative hydrolase of the HAD superfamily
VAPNVLLCDLDGTLIDKAAGFALWADAFAAARGLTTEQRRWLFEADCLHRQRDPFFEAVVDHLAPGEDPEVLWAEYRQQMPILAPAMRGVAAALSLMRENGWLVAVVSNGKSDNQRGKLAAIGLAPLFHGVVISDEVGLRKPDPAIFAAAIEECTKDQPFGAVWLIGDDPLDDIVGGTLAGLNTVWVSGGRAWSDADCAPTATFDTTVEGLAYLLGNVL